MTVTPVSVPTVQDWLAANFCKWVSAGSPSTIHPFGFGLLEPTPTVLKIVEKHNLPYVKRLAHGSWVLVMQGWDAEKIMSGETR